MINKIKYVCLKLLILLVAVAAIGCTRSYAAGQLYTDPAVTPIDNIVGKNSNYIIDFKTSDQGAMQTGGKITIDFTAGNFNLNSSAISASSSANISGAVLAVESNQLEITVGSNGIGNSENVRLVLANIINATIAADNYHLTLTTFNGLGEIIDGPTSTANFSLLADAPDQEKSNLNIVDSNMEAAGNQDVILNLVDQFDNPIANLTVNWSVANSAYLLASNQTSTSINGNSQNQLTAPNQAEQTTVVIAQIGEIELSTGLISSIHAEAISMSLSPEEKTADNEPDTQVEYTARAYDQFNNDWDITDQCCFSVVEGTDGGMWDNNSYKTANIGIWTVRADYGLLSATTVLKVYDLMTTNFASTDADIHLANADQSYSYHLISGDYLNNVDITDLAIYFTSDPNGKFIGNTYYAGKVGTWLIGAIIPGGIFLTSVTVDHPGFPANIAFIDLPQEIIVGKTYQLSVQISDSDGNIIIGPDIDWSIIFKTGSGQIDANGKFYANSTGTIIIQAACENIINKVDLEIKNIPTVASTNDSQPDSKNSGIKNYFVGTAKAAEENPETAIASDENGIIKGTDITTVGAEDLDAGGQSSARALVTSIILALIILASAYFGYNYFGENKLAEVPVAINKGLTQDIDKQNIPNEAVKDKIISQEINQKSEEIKEISKQDDDTEKKLRW